MEPMWWIAEVDKQAYADALVGNHAAMLQTEATEFALAARWAKLTR